MSSLVAIERVSMHQNNAPRHTSDESITLRRVRSFIYGESLFLATSLMMHLTLFHPFGVSEIIQLKKQGRSLVFVGWHGHNFVNLGAYQKYFGTTNKAVIMVRNDPHGLALAHFARRMKFEVVFLGHDPKSLKWAKGVTNMINLVKSGYDALIAVDGPQGPAYQVKPGAAMIALRARAIIVPGVVCSNKAIHLSFRWDEHLVPKPLSRTVVNYGPSIESCPIGGLPPSVEELTMRIEQGLRSGMQKSRVFCNQTEIPKDS